MWILDILAHRVCNYRKTAEDLRDTFYVFLSNSKGSVIIVVSTTE